jgi:hypothetical protein
MRMMNFFCHISEFQNEPTAPFSGANLLPVMLFLSNRLSLWSPSGLQFQEAFRSGNSTLAPKDLLDFVGEGRIQIIGRKEWLTNASSRESSTWRFAPWWDEFDIPVLQMGLQDENRLLTDRRVVFAGDERGWDWAAEQIRGTTPEMKIARERLDARSLPPGFVEKASRVTPDTVKPELREKVQGAARQASIPFCNALQIGSVLRDARNHEDALLLSGCDLPVEPSKHADAIPAIVGRREPKSDCDISLPSSEELLGFLKLLAGLSRPRNAKDLRTLLERKDRQELIAEIWPLLGNPLAALELHRQLQLNPPTWLSVLKPISGTMTPAQVFKLFSVGSLVTAIATASLAPMSILGLLFAIIGYGPELLQKLNVLSAPAYKGPRLPVLLACDRTDPTYRDVSELRQTLIDYFHIRN